MALRTETNLALRCRDPKFAATLRDANRTFRDGDAIWHIFESWYDFDMYYIPNTLFDYLLTQATDLHLSCILNFVCCFGASWFYFASPKIPILQKTSQLWQKNELQTLILIPPTLLDRSLPNSTDFQMNCYTSQQCNC